MKSGSTDTKESETTYWDAPLPVSIPPAWSQTLPGLVHLDERSDYHVQPEADLAVGHRLEVTCSDTSVLTHGHTQPFLRRPSPALLPIVLAVVLRIRKSCMQNCNRWYTNEGGKATCADARPHLLNTPDTFTSIHKPWPGTLKRNDIEYRGRRCLVLGQG